MKVSLSLTTLVNEPDKYGETIAVVYELQKELRRCRSLIGHNNTKHFLCPIKSQHLLDHLEMVW